MMKLIGELANTYVGRGFYIDKDPDGRYRLWVSSIYQGKFDSPDEIRDWCKENLRRANNV